MNKLLEFLNSHSSVRSFTSDDISANEEQQIITTAQRSPTSSNLQLYTIITVRNNETKSTLAELCGGQKHVGDCPLFMIFCADLHRLSLINKSKGYQFNADTAEAFTVATVDCSLVAGRALQAAQALGFGGVMVGGIRNKTDEVARLLNLPDLVYPVMGLSLGKPINKPKIKPRLPIDAISCSEFYSTDKFDTTIQEYDKTISELGYLSGREVEPENYPDYTGIYSWSEHTARRMASNNSGVLRPHMMDFLNSRGFLKR